MGSKSESSVLDLPQIESIDAVKKLVQAGWGILDISWEDPNYYQSLSGEDENTMQVNILWEREAIRQARKKMSHPDQLEERLEIIKRAKSLAGQNFRDEFSCKIRHLKSINLIIVSRDTRTGYIAALQLQRFAQRIDLNLCLFADVKRDLEDPEPAMDSGF